MHPDEFPMYSRWVFWRHRPATGGCPAGCRIKFRHRQRHRELLTRSYNLPDVGSLFGHRINILRSPSGHRPEAGRASVASCGVRIDIGRAAMFTVPDRSSAGTRPMINRRPADLRKASAPCLPDAYATFANLWHIVRPPVGGRADAGFKYNQTNIIHMISQCSYLIVDYWNNRYIKMPIAKKKQQKYEAAV